MEWGLSEIIEHDGFDVVSSFGSPLTSVHWSWEDKLGIVAHLPCSVHTFPGHQLQTTAWDRILD